MVSPERFSNLPEYAFPRLRALLDAHAPGGDLISMSIGDPRHPFPQYLAQTISDAAASFGSYPANFGSGELQTAQSAWLSRRYGVTLDPAQTIAVSGSREALYTAVLALCPDRKNDERPVVLIPNPFYQVYMMGALTLGAEPVFVPATAETGFLPDFANLPPEILRRTAIAFLCSPSNPQGAIASEAYLRDLLALARTHEFQVFADECYTELYRDTPPPGALAVAADMGADPERVVSFHSLSKRSSLPGLRAGFVAGGPASMAAYAQFRAYTGAPIPGPLQAAAARVWGDDEHAAANRALYQAKYRLADEIFDGVAGYSPPEAGFFLWLDVGDGEAATVKLWRETGVRVLPGAYLSQTVNGFNPGAAYIRVALVAPIGETERGLRAIRACLFEKGR